MPFLRSGNNTPAVCPCPACGSLCHRIFERFVVFLNQFPDHTGGDVPTPVYLCLQCPLQRRPNLVFTERAWLRVEEERFAAAGEQISILEPPGDWYIQADTTFHYLAYLWACLQAGAVVVRRRRHPDAVGPTPLPYVSEHTFDSLRVATIDIEFVWQHLEDQGYYVADLRPGTFD